MTDTHPSLSVDEIRRSKSPACQGCALYDANIQVPGFNCSRNVDVLVIGEAPGMEDVFQPYTGPAGDFVRDMLRTAGLLDRARLDNSARCRPFTMKSKGDYSWPSLERPEQADREFCTDKHIIPELRKGNYKVILTLGGSALQTFYPDKKVTSVRGRLLSGPFGIPIFPIVHPAAARRTGSHTDYLQTLTDLQWLAGWLEGKDLRPTMPAIRYVVPPWVVSEPNYNVQCRWPAKTMPDDWTHDGVHSWETFLDAVNALEPLSPIVVDLETTGLNPWADGTTEKRADIVSCSVSVDSTCGWVFPIAFQGTDAKAAYVQFFEFIESLGHRLIFHNAAFDFQYMEVMSMRERAKRINWQYDVECSLMMHHTIYPTSAHGVEDLMTALGYDSHKRLFANHLKAKGAHTKEYYKADWYMLGAYNALDTGIQYRILEWLWTEFANWPNLRKFYEDRVIDSARSAWEMGLAGIPVDYEAVEIAEHHYLATLEERTWAIYSHPEVLRVMIEEWGMPIDGENPLRLNVLHEHFNLGSTQKLSRMFFGDDEYPGLGVPKRYSTKGKSGFYSTDKDVLANILGPEWETEIAANPLARIETDDDGNVTHRLTGFEIFDATARAVAAGVPADRVREKLSPFTAPVIATAITDHRRAGKFLSTYVRALKPEYNEDKKNRPLYIDNGVIHPIFKPHGTVTGRWASFFHTYPRPPAGKKLKRQFRSRFGPDGMLVGADQSQVEARTVAVLSGDQAMIDIFLQDRDLHTEVAADFYQVAPEDVTKAQRTAVKAIHFGTIYRRTPESLAVDLVKETRMPWKDAVEFATNFQKTYFERFHVMYDWRERVLKDLQERKVSWAIQSDAYIPVDPLNYTIVTPFNRKLLLSYDLKYGDLARKSSNFPVQSTANDIMLICIRRIQKELKRRRMRTVTWLGVHDSVYCDCPRDEVDDVAALVKTTMLRRSHLPWISLPFKTDVEVGYNYADMIDYEMMQAWEKKYGPMPREKFTKPKEIEQEIA